ncbi:S26 family signal peptidase [Halorientalis litorea]|jgi:signal peptidase|uniref:S26 family signal peptidase n=1 Tax=Halorientalis litorea TaxID=2931977 RepID=UPI001FF4468B|nr:S26 family signal peptidase [Halorientalis litorea]
MNDHGDEDDGGSPDTADLGPRVDTVDSQSNGGRDEEEAPRPEPGPDPEPGTKSSNGGDGSPLLNDVLSSIFAVLGIGILLFAVSGVWPPMVAIESPSMEPNIDTGDLVFVMDEQRFPGPGAVDDTGVVPADTARENEYLRFNRPGDVIIYEPDGSERATPVIHRAVFWVNESEDWYDKASAEYLPGDAEDCSDLQYCPAPHGGFVTLGDNNGGYDQVVNPSAVSEPVKPEWVVGTAEFRMPGLGWLRLRSVGG